MGYDNYGNPIIRIKITPKVIKNADVSLHPNAPQKRCIDFNKPVYNIKGVDKANTKKSYTEEQKEIMIKYYPDTPLKRMIELTQLKAGDITNLAAILKLRKSEAYKAKKAQKKAQTNKGS